jgi:hypothetical protein
MARIKNPQRVVGVRVPHITYELLKQRSEKENLSLCALIRNILIGFLRADQDEVDKIRCYGAANTRKRFSREKIMGTLKADTITNSAGTGGPSFTNGLIGGAEFVAQVRYPTTTNLLWSRADTSLGSYGTDTDAPSPTVDVNGSEYTVDTTDDDLPTVKLTSAKKGIYVVTATFNYDTSAGNVTHTWAISDGTNNRGIVSELLGTTVADHGRPAISITGAFTYASAATRTFEVVAAATSGTTYLECQDNNKTLTFTIVRYPL